MEDGTVGDVYLISACKDTTYGFERAAINAVWQWTFEPVTVDKEPVQNSASLSDPFQNRKTIEVLIEKNNTYYSNFISCFISFCIKGFSCNRLE